MNKIKSSKRMVVVIAILLFAVFNLAEAGINLPHKYLRTSPNLLSNSNFNGTTDWSISSIPEYDANVSRIADGSGSIKIPVNSSVYAQVRSSLITDFEYNTPYTISFYVKTQHEPVYVNATLHMYDAVGVRTFSYSSGMSATSTIGEWQEVVFVVMITDLAVQQIKVVIEKKVGPTYTQPYYIDDVYFGKGISFAQPPVSTRQTFTGAKVKVDELGNWQVYEAGTWKSYFPFGLQADLTRANFNSLSAQGFNTIFGTQFTSQVQLAKDATSVFNPNGMKAGLRLSTYSGPDSYWTHTRLANDINYIKNNLSETLLCYFWDNENNWAEWAYWFDMIETIRDNDTDHPVYILNGMAGVQRLFSKRLSDVCGTYTGFDAVNYESGFGKMEVLQYLEKQDIPVGIANLNYIEDTSYGFRLRLYYALILGAKGIFWWGDTVKHAEDYAWWSSISTLRNEVDALMPIIRQPHWTDWIVTCSNGKVFYSTRDLSGDGYMIVMNPEESSSQVTFTLDGIVVDEVLNYFDGSPIASVAHDQFTVTLPAHSTAVYQLVGNDSPELLLNGNMEEIGSPLTDWIDYGPGTLTRDSATKYSGAASGKIYNSSTTYNSLLLQYYPILKANTKYRFRVMVKTSNIVKSNPADNYSGAIIQLYAGGANMFLPTGGLAGTNGWQLVEREFTTPATPNTSWYVRLQLKNASGTVWFDNASLKEVNDNILSNGDMEEIGSPLTDWIPTGSGVKTRDTATKYSGAASGKIYNSATTYDSTLLQFYPVLKANTTYKFSVMMKTSGVVKADPNNDYSGAIVQVYAGGVNKFPPTGGLAGTNDWQLVEQEFTTSATPNTSWFIRLRLWDASGTVWFDNAMLTEL
jgi:hypothetical protein